jgi:hypothetical protein
MYTSGDFVSALGSNFTSFSSFESQLVNASSVFRNLTGSFTDRLCLGDKWEVRLSGWPANCDIVIPSFGATFSKVTQTDGSGNAVMTGTADTVGAFSRQYFIVFPIALYLDSATNPGYVDSSAPKGYRHVGIAFVDFTVLAPQTSASGNLMANDAQSIICGCNRMDAAASSNWNATNGFQADASGYVRGRPTCTDTSAQPAFETPVITMPASSQPTYVASPSTSSAPVPATATPSTATPPPSVLVAAGSSPAIVASDWLTGQYISGIPNWAVVAAAAAVLVMMLGSGK